jgi:hypothetical protein
MLAALASPKGSAAYGAAWGKVNDIFAQDCTYLFLTQLVTAFAARDNVQNWAYSAGFRRGAFAQPRRWFNSLGLRLEVVTSTRLCVAK